MPVDKEAVEKLDHIWAIMRFFHSFSQVITYFQIKLILLYSAEISFAFYRRWCLDLLLLAAIDKSEIRR